MASAIGVSLLASTVAGVSNCRYAGVLEQLHSVTSDVVRANSVPARTDRIEDDEPVEVQRCHLQQRKLLVREGRIGVVEKVVFIHALAPFP